MAIYAQVVNGIVNLIGGKEVGLPLPPEFLAGNPNVLNIILLDSMRVNMGDYYEDGEFYNAEAWHEKHSADMTFGVSPTTNDIQAAILLNQMEILSKLEIQQEATALLFLESIGGQGNV